MRDIIHRAFVCCLALVGCLSIAASASAQQPVQNSPKQNSPDRISDVRVEVMMEGLPPAGSADYEDLFKHAGDAKGQVLPLTNCEVWSIRPSLLENLKVEAAKKNVGVRVLDGDWNKVFQPMAPSVPMTEKASSMMEQAMQSPSTAAVGMMSARAANLVEYALIKDMHVKGDARNPMTIRIAVNDKTSVSAVRRSVEIKGDRCIWRGVVEGTENPVTIMWWASGRITGTIHHGDRLYQLKQMGDDTIGIVETMTDKMPDEHAGMRPERMRQLNLQQDTMRNNGDASMGRPKRGETQNQQDGGLGGTRTAVVDQKALKRQIDAAAHQSAKAKGPKVKNDIVIDVMIAYTAKAASHYDNIERDLIELVIDDAETSFRTSGIDNVKLRLVHTHKTDYAETGAEHFDHVWRMVDKGDGFMEEIPALRNEKKADVVMLVVDDAQGCGLATRVAAEAEEAFAVVHHECAANTFTLAHELGHLLGARHDRMIDMSTTPFAFGHGFIDPMKRWRTMMSYKASCDGCPRLPIWSSPLAKVVQTPAGDERHDNARVIREQAARVAAFR